MSRARLLLLLGVGCGQVAPPLLPDFDGGPDVIADVVVESDAPMDAGACGRTRVPGVVLTTLAGNREVPSSLAVNTSYVYWAEQYEDAQAVQRCPLSGCIGAPTPVAAGQATLAAVAADGVNVYWATLVVAGQVLSCPATGCTGSPTVIATGQSEPVAIATDGTNVYWANGGDGTVMQCAVSGCSTPIVLASGQKTLMDIAVDATSVYWTAGGDQTILDGGSVMRCAIGGCGGAPTTIASGLIDPTGIAVDDSNVYWANTGGGYDVGTVVTCPTAGCGTTPTVLATCQHLPLDVAVDDTNVYWINDVDPKGDPSDGEVLQCAKNGCDGIPSVVASGPGLRSLAVNGTHLYWASNFTPGSIVAAAPK